MLFDNLLVKERKESGKVVIAGKVGKEVRKGIVVSAGPGQAYGLPKFEKTMVEEGDVIFFLRDHAYEVEVRGEERWIVRERDVLCVLAKEE